MRCAWHIAHIMANAYKMLVGRGKRHVGSSRRILEDNIKTDLKEID
jgi:hypothetical protein